jgi:hypothetical protein
MAPARLGPWIFLLLLSFSASAVYGQQTTTQPATSDPQAVALAAKALAALTGGKPITDVTLTGTATRTAGSDVETGAITLKALGSTNSRMDFSGSGGTRIEVRNSSSGVPQGSWIGTDGVSHAMVSHNCLTDAVWFFPAFSVLSQIASTNVIATYVGQETRNGASVQHIRFTTHPPNVPSAAIAFVSSLTTEDVYLDSTSLLPVAIAFNSHADSDAAVQIATEVDFTGYRPMSGVAVPSKIQELLNGGLYLDISVESADLNSGLSNSVFDL